MMQIVWAGATSNVVFDDTLYLPKSPQELPIIKCKTFCRDSGKSYSANEYFYRFYGDSTLSASNYMTKIKMNLGNLVADNDFSAGFEITTASGGLIIVSIKMDNLAVFAQSVTGAIPVTLTPNFSAGLYGVSDISGNCGNGDPKMMTLIGTCG